jgi:hypothetical protein
MQSIRAKYSIDDIDIYNFDETGLMMGVITPNMVVTRAERRRNPRKIQPGNREWATVIQWINAQGWCIPPFIVVKAAHHLANWYSECNLPPYWINKPTENGWKKITKPVWNGSGLSRNIPLIARTASIACW